MLLRNSSQNEAAEKIVYFKPLIYRFQAKVFLYVREKNEALTFLTKFTVISSIEGKYKNAQGVCAQMLQKHKHK